MKDLIIGIDLGTTNSEVAVFHDGRVIVLEENGSALLPSYVGLNPEGKLIVGQEARNQYILHPEATIKSIKRKMGSPDKVKLGDTSYSPAEISAFILKELKARAERFLGQEVKKAVITVPAFFNDAQRQATRDAGAIAGLEVVRILNEPTAACLAYEHGVDKNEAKTVLAYDLGGGTFDVSIVKVSGEVVEVIASHGDNQLGGDDFDELLFKDCLAKFAAASHSKSHCVFSEIASNRLRRASENAKMQLSESAATKIIEDNLVDSSLKVHHLEQSLTRRDFENLIEPLLERTLDSVHKALEVARLSLSDIDEVLLVGGSTRIPAVGERIEDLMGKRPRCEVHPDLAVALGAGVLAARLMGCASRKLLIDISPYTFGVATLSSARGIFGPYHFAPILKAGSPLPLSRGQVFYTMGEGQNAVQVDVYQGENDDVRKNLPLGEFLIEGLDPKAPRSSEILCNMQLDLDGILTVTAIEKATGLAKTVRMEGALKKHSDDEIRAARARLAALRGDEAGFDDEEEDGDFADDVEMPAFVAEIGARIAKVEDQLDEVDRGDLERLLGQLGEAVGNDDEDEVTRLRQEIDDILFYVESK